MNGTEFRLAGTEVFHAACVHLIEQSVGTKRHKALLEANRQLIVEREQNRRLEQDLEDTRIDCNRKNQRIYALERAKADTDAARETIAALQADLGQARRDRSAFADERDRLRRELSEAQTILATAKKELDALRAAAAATPAPADAQTNDNDYGGAEARFKLLELD